MQGLDRYVPALGIPSESKHGPHNTALSLRNYTARISAIAWELDAALFAERSALNQVERETARARVIAAHRSALRQTQALKL